jgi:hypothetical protein
LGSQHFNIVEGIDNIPFKITLEGPTIRRVGHFILPKGVWQNLWLSLANSKAIPEQRNTVAPELSFSLTRAGFTMLTIPYRRACSLGRGRLSLLSFFKWPGAVSNQAEKYLEFRGVPPPAGVLDCIRLFPDFITQSNLHF